jgi:hypothetical protein
MAGKVRYLAGGWPILSFSLSEPHTNCAASGLLTPLTPATVSTGGSPFGVTMDHSGKFAYVPNAYGNNDVS